MPGLKEQYNSTNPNMKLEPENGWYRMYPSDEDPETALSIGICFSETRGWGYWDYNYETREKEWISIEVPEIDPSLVKRTIPYTEEEQKEADEIIATLRPVFQKLREIFPGNDSH